MSYASIMLPQMRTARRVSFSPIYIPSCVLCYDNFDLTSFYVDDGTTVAIPNQQIYRQDDKGPFALHRRQTNSAIRPHLRGTPIEPPVFSDDFTDGNTDGWGSNNATLAVVGGQLEVTATTSVAGNGHVVLDTEPGRVYRLDYKQRGGTGTAIIRFGTAPDSNAHGQTIGSNPGTTHVSSQWFLATTSTTYIACRITGGIGATAYYDDLVVYDASHDKVGPPYGLQFRHLNVSSWMSTSALDLSGTDALTVCWGVRKLRFGSDGEIVQLGAPNSNGSFRLTDMNSGDYRFISRGTANRTATVAGYPHPSTNVLVGMADISADQCILRIDGVQGGSDSADAGAGTYQNAPVYFGSNQGGSLYFNGLDFGGAIFREVLAANHLANMEQWNGARAGVPL